ncbi:MAG: folate-binding protein YgfZ [Verrucomicrobiales bacterium]|jgi:folate-binding protein YgfZ
MNSPSPSASEPSAAAIAQMLADGGAVNLSHRPKFQLSGVDRVRYLSGQVTQAVSDVSESQTLYACITNHKGKMDGDLFITGSNDLQSFQLDTDPALAESLHARLDRYIIADDVELIEVTADWHLFHVIGKHPLVTGISPRTANRYGVPGIDYWIPSSSTLPESLQAIPALHESALEIIRITNGIGKWGADLSPDFLPPEARLEERAISYTKGCYIGQEVISRIRSVGRVNRTLELIEAVESDALEPGMELKNQEGKTVGSVTSAILHPAHADGPRWIGLAYVKKGSSEPGTRLSAQSTAANSDAEQIILSSTVEVRNNSNDQEP